VQKLFLWHFKRFDFLHWFEGIVVSGTEKTRKPFSAIYQITLDRYQLNPTNSLFIDDNERNIVAAQRIGNSNYSFSKSKATQNFTRSFGN